MGVIPLGQRVHERVELGLARGIAHAVEIHGLRRCPERDVSGDARIGEKDRLRHVRDAALPAAAVLRGQRDSVDGDAPLRGFEKAHQQIGERALAASRLADQCDPPSARYGKADIVERRRAAARVGEAHLLDGDPVAEGEGRRLVGGLFVNRKLQQPEHLGNQRSVPARQRPAGIDLLEQRQQALGAERERAEDRKRDGEAALARRDQDRKHGDEDRPQRLDDEARGGADEGGARAGGVEAVVDPAEGVEIHGLRTVDDHVADAAEALLEDLDPFVVGRAHDFGISRQPLAGEGGDQHIDERERRRGRDRRQRIDRDQHGDDEQGDEQRDSRLDHLLEHGEGQYPDLLQRRDERARVLTDVKGVGLEQQPALDVDREIVAEAEDKLLARPRQLQAHRAGKQREGNEQAGCRDEALPVGGRSDRVEGGGEHRHMRDAMGVGEQ